MNFIGFGQTYDYFSHFIINDLLDQYYKNGIYKMHFQFICRHYL